MSQERVNFRVEQEDIPKLMEAVTVFTSISMICLGIKDSGRCSEFVGKLVDLKPTLQKYDAVAVSVKLKPFSVIIDGLRGFQPLNMSVCVRAMSVCTAYAHFLSRIVSVIIQNIVKNSGPPIQVDRSRLH